MARFSSISGTISATVANAAIGVSVFANLYPASACTSLSATPAPQSSANGYF